MQARYSSLHPVGAAAGSGVLADSEDDAGAFGALCAGCSSDIPSDFTDTAKLGIRAAACEIRDTPTLASLLSAEFAASGSRKRIAKKNFNFICEHLHSLLQAFYQMWGLGASI
jgi:hypothetical protein